MNRLSVSTIGQFCLAFTLASGLVGLHAQTPAPDTDRKTLSPEENQARKEWRAAIHAVPTPKVGCFHASYPNTQWEQVACEESTPILHTRDFSKTPTAEGISPLTVGAGHDVVAQAPHGYFIQAALGEFTDWTDLKSEKGAEGSNQYSLQMNTNDDHNSPACDGYSGCISWQQYVLASTFGSTGKTLVFIQDWLIGYGYERGVCPAGWTYALPFGNASQCVKNSKAAAVYNGAIPITKLPELELLGSAAYDGTDQVEAYYGKDVYRVTTPDQLTDISSNWSQVEFNVFGNGGGSGAKFNSGAGLEVAVVLDYGASIAPKCQPPSKVLGTTAETNNLTLISCESGVDSGGYPFIQFIEEN